MIAASDLSIVGALNNLVSAQRDLISMLRNTIDEDERQFQELRQLVADLDDSTPSRRAFEELHNRVDALESLLGPAASASLPHLQAHLRGRV